MSVYLITYDLRSQKRDYQALYDRFSELGKWVRVTESSVAISTLGSVESVHDSVWQVMTKNDRLLVGRLNEACWIGIPKQSSDWLERQEF